MTLKELKLSSFFPGDWRPSQSAPASYDHMRLPKGQEYVLWAVLERNADYGDEHGPKRLSLLHFGYDAFAVFQRVFCEGPDSLPYACLLAQPMGWIELSGDRSHLGDLARRSGKRLPQWLFVEQLNEPWPGYEEVSRMSFAYAGSDGRRFLYRARTSSALDRQCRCQNRRAAQSGVDLRLR